jgi:hypothetical protein
VAEARGPGVPASSRQGPRYNPERDASDFVHDLCRDHADWIDDRTLGGTTPLGWRPLVRFLLEGMRAAMGSAPGARVSLARLEGRGDRLLVEVRNHEGRPTPNHVLLALEAMIDEAERVSGEVCPFCGQDFGPGAALGRLARHLGSRPTCRPSGRVREILRATGDL